ncbi:MAG TPA: phosphate ABC transporter substrate-binding protein PstS [Gemmatimonadaceae bacterium]|jgi:phosphate transport system substrate-binding protein|nr:phosphate ABC transporter substrate-binding protein PstS [Gemmatimonadaceae bacterium]
MARVTRFVSLAAIGAMAFVSTAAAQDLNGAGATFPDPIYKKWFSDYAAKTGVKINYQAIGSGGGIKQFQEGTVDFGASDAPMTDEEMSKLKTPAFHIPTVLGAVVITYNLSELAKPLNLTGDVVGSIFRGKITKWNDSQIAALNRGVALPNKDILVVHRSDGSGTTYIFSDYLTAVSPAWKSGPGKGKDLQWPVGLGGKGNDGVAGQVAQVPGSIGYIELAYARQKKLPYAALKNAAGNFVLPSIESVTESAAAIASKLPANTDFRVSIVNAPGANAYPISSFTYLLVSETQPDPVKGKKLIDFIKWAIHDGEKDAAGLDYAPLPKNVVTMLDKRLGSVRNVASK